MYRISVPYAQKDPRFLFEKRRGQPGNSLASTIDGSTLPQDCVLDTKELVKHKIKKKEKIVFEMFWGDKTSNRH